jgi:hypothetical protein
MPSLGFVRLKVVIQGTDPVNSVHVKITVTGNNTQETLFSDKVQTFVETNFLGGRCDHWHQPGTRILGAAWKWTCDVPQLNTKHKPVPAEYFEGFRKWSVKTSTDLVYILEGEGPQRVHCRGLAYMYTARLRKGFKMCEFFATARGPQRIVILRENKPVYAAVSGDGSGFGTQWYVLGSPGSAGFAYATYDWSSSE